jgi:hypothetical protein
MSRTTRRAFLRTAALGTAALTAKARGFLGKTPGVQDALGHARSARRGSERLRGLMVDAARLPEKPSYYRRLIDFCYEWNLNALHFRLTDDQGSMLRFESHPELITHRHALTPKEAHDLAEYGERYGVTVIPEVESFGHTRYITGTPKYAHLLDQDPNGNGAFNGLIPVDPETLTLIGDLYREVAGIFPSRYLHGGCDEVNWGGSELSRRALQTKSRDEIWAEYLNSLDDICQQLDKELIVWGDAVVHIEPGILPRLNKRVIVMDWQYHVTDPQPLARVAQEVMDQGLRVIGAPAIIFCEWGPRIAHQQLRNLDAFADAYSGIRDSRCLGVIATNWAPGRYLQGSLWDSFAYAAVAFNEGSGAARESGFRSFVERFYQASWNSTWQEIFDTYYCIAPNRHSCAPEWQGPPLPIPWASEADLLALLHSGVAQAPSYTRLRSQIHVVADSVRRNSDDFSALALSAEYLDYAYWRDKVAIESVQMPNTHIPANLIEAIAARDRKMVKMLDAEWNVGRFETGKLQAILGMTPGDQLVFRMHQAAEFSSGLAGDGDQFDRFERFKNPRVRSPR